MTSLSRRSAAAPLLPLTAVVALTPTQLVANFPAILDTIQSHHLLTTTARTTATASNTAPPSSAASTLYTRFLTKCLGLISQGQRASNPPEQWCGLQLLQTLIRQSSPAALMPYYQQIVAALTELQKQSGYQDDVLDVPLLECMTAVLCSAAEAGGEIRREMMTTQLNKTVGIVIDRLTALLPTSSSVSPPASSTTSTPLRRLLSVLDELLSVYVSSLRSFSGRLQPLVTSLLLHCDESCLPPLLSALTTVLVSMTSAAATQQSNKAKQARMQQNAQDTTDEITQQKLTTIPASSSPPFAASTAQPSSSSPYYTYTAACLHDMTALLNELRQAVGEQPAGTAVSGTQGGGLGWEAVGGEGVVRGLEVVRRYERLCAVLSALVAPQLPPAIAASSVELSVPLLPTLHVLSSALGLEPYASAGDSAAAAALTPSAALFVLPSLYDSSLRLLDTLLQHCRHAVLPFAYPLSALLVDLHRRCTSTPSVESLLPAVHHTLAYLFQLPLSPALLAVLSGSFLSSLLVHVQQPFVLRRELAMQQTSQSMASQLKATVAHNKRNGASTAASSAASELVGQQESLREEVAAAALASLHSMLEAGSLLPLPARTTIDSTLLLLSMSLASTTSSSFSPLPASIRLPLYRCLVSALVHPPAASPSSFTSPLLPYALPVLSRGAQAGDEEGGVCRAGLLVCEWLVRERGGVLIGKRRAADRLLDGADSERQSEQDVHLLDRLDDWSGVAVGEAGTERSAAAAAAAEQGGGVKRRRAASGEEWKERERATASSPAPLNGRRSVIEQTQEERVAMEEKEADEQRETTAEEAAEQTMEMEQKHATEQSTGEHSDGDAEEQSDDNDEDEQQSHGDEQDEGEGVEVVEASEEKTSNDEAKDVGVSSTFSGYAAVDVEDDDDFGAVLHVDDDDDQG